MKNLDYVIEVLLQKAKEKYEPTPLNSCKINNKNKLFAIMQTDNEEELARIYIAAISAGYDKILIATNNNELLKYNDNLELVKIANYQDVENFLINNPDCFYSFISPNSYKIINNNDLSNIHNNINNKADNIIISPLIILDNKNNISPIIFSLTNIKELKYISNIIDIKDCLIFSCQYPFIKAMNIINNKSYDNINYINIDKPFSAAKLSIINKNSWLYNLFNKEQEFTQSTITKLILANIQNETKSHDIKIAEIINFIAAKLIINGESINLIVEIFTNTINEIWQQLSKQDHKNIYKIRDYNSKQKLKIFIYKTAHKLTKLNKKFAKFVPEKEIEEQNKPIRNYDVISIFSSAKYINVISKYSFDDSKYLEEYGDLQIIKNAGKLHSAFNHYFYYGIHEGRNYALISRFENSSESNLVHIFDNCYKEDNRHGFINIEQIKQIGKKYSWLFAHYKNIDYSEISKKQNYNYNYNFYLLYLTFLYYTENKQEYLTYIAYCLYKLGNEKISEAIITLQQNAVETDIYIKYGLEHAIKSKDKEAVSLYLPKYIKITENPYDSIFIKAALEFLNQDDLEQLYRKYWQGKLSWQDEFEILKSLGYYHEALAIFEKDETNFGNMPVLWKYSYAEALIANSNFKKAKSLFDKEKSISIAYNNNIAFLYEMCGDYNTALNYYNESAKLGYSFNAQIAIIRDALPHMKRQKIIHAFELIIKNSGYHHITYLWLANTAFYFGKIDMAIKALEAALTFESAKNTNFELHCKFLLILFIAHSGQYEKAYEMASNFIANAYSYNADTSSLLQSFKLTLIVLLRLKPLNEVKENSKVSIANYDLKKRIETSNDLLKEISYHKNDWNFIVNYQTGDTYLFLALLKRFKKLHNNEKIIIHSPKRLLNICKLFEDVIDEIIVFSDEIDNFYMHSHFNKFDKGQPLLTNPHFLARFGNSFSRFDNEDKSFLQRLEIAMEIGEKAKMPINHPKYDKNCNIEVENGVLLVPTSNSFKMLDKSFWDNIADYYLNKGIKVYENCGPEGGINIKGAIPLYFKHIDALSICNKIGHIIGIRTGFLDIISGIEAKMDVIYPVISYESNWVKSWTLQHYCRSKELREHIISLEDVRKQNYNELIKNIIKQ